MKKEEFVTSITLLGYGALHTHGSVYEKNRVFITLHSNCVTVDDVRIDFMGKYCDAEDLTYKNALKHIVDIEERLNVSARIHYSNHLIGF